MSAPESPAEDSRPKFFHRRFAPLVTAWVVALAVSGLIYWFEWWMPAFHEVVLPLYWVVAGLTVFATWRWVRVRGMRDRRATDRRHGERRKKGSG